MHISPEIATLLAIFRPDGTRRRQAIEEREGRFVHYTSADAARRILESREIWLRNASCMNDVSEVEHGLERLAHAYRTLKFRDVLSTIVADAEKFENRFNAQQETLRQDTYLGCFSEHDDDEDTSGRLSMWRAYGHGHGVAIVMNNRVFLQPSDALGAYTNPVAYFNDTAFQAHLATIASNISANLKLLKAAGPTFVEELAFQTLRFSALCTKHPGFREEREWRVVFSPADTHPGIIKSEIETINGMPQRVCKIPLKDIPEEGLIGLEPSKLIERIILSPTQYETSLFRTFVDLLHAAGVEDAVDKVFISDLPLRL